MSLFLLPAALAGDVFGTVDAEVAIGGGTWARLHPMEDGWMFFQAVGGEAWAEDLTDTLGGYDDRGRIQLTEHGSLQDVQQERCPDGTWLLAGSYTLDTFDDSAAIWHYAADFTLLDTFPVEERNEERAHNDMAVLCNEVVTGIAYNADNGRGSYFLEADLDAGAITSTTPMDWAAMGGSLALRDSDQRIVGADINGPQDDVIRLSTFEADWSTLDLTQVPVPEDTAFWPQRLLPLDDGWVLAYLTRPASETAGDGDVWLMALDADFNMIDNIRVSPEGTRSARPWVARKGSVLAVSYDRDVQPRITLVHLQDGSVPDDDDLPDTGATDEDDTDTADDGNGDADADAGCACGGGAPALVLAPMAALLRRRKARTVVG